MSFKYLICDLDNTLYSGLSGMLEAINQRINVFMAQKFNMAAEEIKRLRYDYWRKYGTTLAGLLIHHRIPPADYIRYAYDINIADFLKPDPRLAEMLGSINLTRVIFSNSPAGYIERVLEVLEVSRYFSRIYDIEFCKYLGKPNISSYLRVLSDLGAKGEECIMVDDTLVNLRAAWHINIIPIYINRDLQQSLPWEIKEIYDLGAVLQKIDSDALFSKYPA